MTDEATRGQTGASTPRNDAPEQTAVEKRRRLRVNRLISEHPLVRGAHGPIERGRFGLADLHMHSNFSDGTGTVEEVLAYVEHKTPLDVIALTDHDTIEGALRARDLVARRNYRYEFIVGEEVSTREGHVLALFIEKRIPPALSVERTIELIHAQGGLAVIAHPFNPVFRHSVQRSVMDRLLRQPDMHPDGVESLNGSFAGIGSSAVTMRLARARYGWPELGGSDAHTPTAIGCAHTLFLGQGAAGLREAITRGATAPQGGYWLTREYVILASHHVAFGHGKMYTAEERPAVRAARLRSTAFGWSARAAQRYIARKSAPAATVVVR